MSQSDALPSFGDLHDDQVLALLRSGAHAARLIAYFGEVEYRELCQLAKLAVTRRNTRGRRVLILPGMMGSRLGHLHRRAHTLIWLHPTIVSNGSLIRLALPGPRSLRATGVMLHGYLKLRLRLEIAGFRALFFPYDWRRDLGGLARALLRTIENMGERRALIVGHSMGGLVARAALAQDRERRIARIVQLGSPNQGSFAPVQALRAVYPTVRKLAALDSTRSAEELARAVFHTFPGIYQLLPGAQDGSQTDLFEVDNWPADDLTPDAAMLARARKARARLPVADERCAVIIGVGQETAVAATAREDGFEYLLSFDGDGTVPVTRARWQNAAMWFVAENHGALTQNDLVLAALTDILKNGATSRLHTTPPAPPTDHSRRVTDQELRRYATRKVTWDALSLDSRRRILEPVISAEFIAPIS